MKAGIPASSQFTGGGAGRLTRRATSMQLIL